MARENKAEEGQPNRLKSTEDFIILESAYQEIANTVGRRPAESGGILLGSREDFVVQKFVFDHKGSMSAGAYDPNTEFLNKVVKKEWNENKLAFLGFLHSHPRGLSRLSGDWGGNVGDIGYMKAILKAIPDLKKFLVPIIFSPADGGELTFFPYIAYPGREENYFTGNLKLIKDKDYVPASSEQNKNEYRLNISRLQGSVDPELMRRAKVVCVGVGGANGICESLVRSGLGKIVLIDFDRVDGSNLVTQGYYMEDIGKLKVDAVRERIRRINPAVQVEVLAGDFTTVDDETMDHIMYGTDLLLMMTDNFHAQAHGNIIGLKYQVPTVFAMMYERARGAEIGFMIPGITPACHRCVTSSRYAAYLNEGYTNDVTSTGSTNFHTGYLNNCIGLLSLAILHKETSGLEFSQWFGAQWDQNQIILRTSPFFESKSFGSLTQKDERMVSFDAIWHHIEPDVQPKYKQCPDCGGLGDLRDAFLHHQSIKSE
ncbi:MAG: ThiF family adenylyltransferase [Chitinophagaceae bacterium]|nr:ThiF family adenylyltransferase [Chitinophagaceae bacterium]